MGMFDGLINQLQGQINQYNAATVELTNQYNTARADLQKQTDAAVGNANSEATLALGAREAWNMKATMLENATVNLGLPKIEEKAKPKPSIAPILFLGLGALGYLYYKGKLKI